MNNRRDYFFIVFALIVMWQCTNPSSAQAMKKPGGGISGFIMDRGDSTALSDVNIFLQNTMLGAASDKKGRFFIRNIPPGNYNLVVMMMGYRSLIVKNIQVLPGKTRVLSIKLRKKVLELGGVKVTADKATYLVDQERSLAGHEIITPRFVVEKAGAFEDAYRAMMTLPSVVTRNDINTQLYVRGGSPDQNQVLFEGIEILNPSRLFVVMGGGVSIVNPDIIQAIDLAPGGFEVNYGNKMSALMKINTREGRRDEVSIHSSLALISARTVAEGPFARGRGSWLIAGRRSFYDMIANHVFSKNYVFPYFYDLHSKVAYNLSTNSKLIGFYSFLSEGAQLYNFENESLDLLNKGRGNIAGLRYNSIINSKLAVNLLAGYYTDANNVRVYDTFNYAYYAKLNYKVRRTSLHGEVHYYPFDWLMLLNGTQTDFNHVDLVWNSEWRNYLYLPEGIKFSSRYVHNSAFWQARFKVQKWFEWTGGFRYDYSTLYNEANWSPRCKLIFAPVQGLTVWYNIGLFSQFPDLLTIISRGEPLDITQNTNELRAERALHHIVGLKWEPDRTTTVKLELYFKDFDRLLTSTDEGSFVPENHGIGLARGLELSFQRLRLDNSRLGFWMNYSFCEAKYQRTRAEEWIYFDYDQRHQISTGAELRLSKRWDLSGVWHVGSGFPYTPILALRQNMDGSGSMVDGWDVIKAEKNSARYPGYSRMDVRLSYHYYKKNREFTAYLDLINVLNQKNIYQYEWDFYATNGGAGAVGNRSVIYMVPFIPSIGVSFNL